MADTNLYDQKFYQGLDRITRRSAEVMVPLLVANIAPTSVLDVGCGQGAFLAAFAHHGVKDVFGLDGDYVARDRLQIPQERFAATDLSQPFDLGRRFDLTLSLEVAEHLPEASAKAFIASLVRHSNLIIFSAAFPNQGGIGHVNERWPSYWARHFKAHGFLCFDVLRKRLWRNADVAWWYRQNLLVFATKEESQRHDSLARPSPLAGLDLVHPELWRNRNTYLKNLQAKKR